MPAAVTEWKEAVNLRYDVIVPYVCLFVNSSIWGNLLRALVRMIFLRSSERLVDTRFCGLV